MATQSMTLVGPCLPAMDCSEGQGNDDNRQYSLPVESVPSMNDELNDDKRNEYNRTIEECSVEIGNSETSTVGTTHDDLNSDSPTYLARTLNAIREGASIAGLLRIGGAVLMVMSLSAFLMQGVDAPSDLHRYLLLLGQTLLLSAAGFSVGFWLKEPRGARVFFSLGLISIPANFAVLGAMIYSITPLDGLITQYPAYASWQSASLNELLIAAAAALMVLLPMSLFCFAVMARQSKWWLSACYLLASATLLIPMRDTFSITLISSLCTVAIVILLAARQKNQKHQATSEEKFAKALLFIPPILMLSRSAMLYGIDPPLALAMVFSIHYLFRKLVIGRTDNNPITTITQLIAAGTGLTIVLLATEILNREFNIFSGNEPFLLFTTLWLLVNLDLLRFFKGTRLKATIHVLWAICCCMPILADLSDFNGRIVFAEVLPLPLLIIGAGIIIRHKVIVIIGILALAALLIDSGSHLFTLALEAGWLGMAIAGASTIVAGSVLERFWPVIKLRTANHFAKRCEIQQ